MTTKCMDCKERTPGCHSGCIHYLASTLAEDEAKSKIKETKRKKLSHDCYTIKAIQRTKRKKR